MTVQWPSALKARRVDAHLRNFVATGGRNIFGREQRVFSDAGYWEVTYTEIVVGNRAAHDAYQMLIARLREGEDVVARVPSHYDAIGAKASSSAASLAADAPLRATEITLTVSGIGVAPGVHLGIQSRLHRVTEIVSVVTDTPYENRIANDSPWEDDQPWVDEVSAEATYTLKVIPPLRNSYVTGQAVKFTDVQLRCVLKDMTDGDLSLEMPGYGFPSFTLREHI